MIPLSLYIHIPWCVRKCPYCDFNSHQAPESLPETAYIDALLSDFAADIKRAGGRPISTIFIGGGTPSLFSASAIDRLLSGIHKLSPLTDDTEITLEANPGTFEQERFNDFRKAGINRLSIGIQSFNSNHLKALGRIHNGDEALVAADIARQAGFENFNLDLMFGLPQQSTENALEDLQQAIACNPTHLSWYQLTLEPNTLFHHQPPKLPEHEALWEMQQAGQALLSQHNYEQYEVSAYSRSGKQSQHNRNYWEFGDYIGIGAGAHGKLTDADGVITRTTKYRQPKQYLEQAAKNLFLSSDTKLAVEDLPFEFMLNALRLKTGVDSALYEQRTGQPLSSIQAVLEDAQASGLLNLSDGKVSCTEKGWRFLDNTLTLFL
ncbi:radical SAM family heme chaperone HemW [Leucothrix sargassi]|nr:radical SAM family heme chaperone HemW [Leucothrix sargassi]